jgi:O-antigen/teichoic acid export membrane protein
LKNRSADTVASFSQRLFSFSIGTVVSAVLNLVSVPLLTWFVSPDDIGKAAFFSTVLSLLTAYSYLGLDQSFIREYYEIRDKKKLLRHTALFSFAASSLLSVAILLFPRPLSNLLFAEYDQWMVLILASMLPVFVLDRYTSQIIRMEEKGILYSFFQILQKILEIGCVFPLLFFFRQKFRAVIVAFALSFIVTVLIKGFISFRLLGRESQNLHAVSGPFFDTAFLKRVFIFGMPTVIAIGFSWILNAIDRIALRYLSDFNQLGLYANAFKVAAFVSLIKQAFANFWTPTSYRWFKDDVDIQRFETVSHAFSFCLFFVFSGLVSFRWVLRYFFAPSYYPSIELIPVLLFIPVLQGVSETTFIGINFTRKSYIHLLVSILSAGVNVLGNLMLVPRHGALGAACSTAAAFIVFFSLRSLISNRVWKPMRLRKHYLNLLILTAHVVTSLVLKDPILLNFVFMAVLLTANRDVIKLLFQKYLARSKAAS